MKVQIILSAALAALALGGPSWADEATAFALMRNSVIDPAQRIHVASFDTDNGEAYNRENCNLVATLLQRQEGVTARFWCEKGSFKP